MASIAQDKSNGLGTSNIWDSLLESVAARTVRASPTKTLLVLGGTVGDTRKFVDLLRDHVKSKKSTSGKNVIPTPCSNFATFTYVDIQDPDTEEHLGRIRIYLLPGHESAHLPALKDFLVSQDPEDLICCLLFDWHTPWTWMRSLQFWLQSLSGLMAELQRVSPDFDLKCQDQIKKLETQIRTFTENNHGVVSTAQADPSLSLPLEPGEFDKPLGMSLICVAQNAEYTQILESDHGMREEQFDFVQQVIRTVLLRYGGALIYTTTLADGTLSLPYRYVLREHFAIAASELYDQKSDKAVTVVRDQVFVPTGWDSWGKIKALREGFDTEGISNGWDIDLEDSTEDGTKKVDASMNTVNVYEEVIVQPRSLRSSLNTFYQDDVVVPIDPMAVLKRIEQRQWEVQEAQQEQNQDYETSPDRFRASHLIDRSDTSERSRDTQSDGHAVRPALRMGPQNSTGKSGADKDEYVQAFFQNLLNRSNSEKPE